jgi:uncharacterized SAM-binding protein YcdF (DUF218 family)
MFLKTIATSLLLPPFVFVLLIAAGLLLLRRSLLVGKILAGSALCLLILCATPVVADVMMRMLQPDLPLQPVSTPPPAAIIVLGADIERSTDDAVGAHLGFLSLERVRTAAIVAHSTHLPILVSGGLIQLDRPPVADLMAATLSQNFNLQTTWIENKSSTTFENAKLSANILRDQHIRSAYLVTHAWHMRRALIAFANTDLTVIAVSASSPGPFRVTWSDFIPRASVWEFSYYAFHEWVGCAWYLVRIMVPRRLGWELEAPPLT